MSYKRKKLCIMGGTFDPIHNGHLQMAQHCMQKFCFDKMLFIPTGDPPHKKNSACDKYHRLNMTRLALQDIDWADVSEIEVERNRTTYTFDTLNQLKSEYIEWDFYYIIGADTLKELHTWYRINDVATLTKFVLVGRNGTDIEQQETALRYVKDNYGASIIHADLVGLNISSTIIRNMVLNNSDFSSFVPESVGNYIKENGLYKRA